MPQLTSTPVKKAKLSGTIKTPEYHRKEITEAEEHFEMTGQHRGITLHRFIQFGEDEEEDEDDPDKKIDFDVFQNPAERSKKGHPHQVKSSLKRTTKTVSGAMWRGN